jgi:uncharacterized pyridoxamine 5'-phosphate oxidase family protein
MSLSGQLTNFKKVILVSSLRDKYVSWHSARLENYNKDLLKQITFRENEMLKNILSKDSKIERIDRLEIDFKLTERYFSPYSVTWTRSSDEHATSNC